MNSDPQSKYLRWSGEITNREAKELVAKRLAGRLQDGECVGVGSGSTSYLTILALGDRIRLEGLRCLAIPTSAEVALACRAVGFVVTSLMCAQPSWGFDGADEVDPGGNLIKGRGGALFQEKLMMAIVPEMYIVADPSKRVSHLGEKFAIPVETSPFALHHVEQALGKLGATEITLRLAVGKDGPVITEQGNFLLDCRFDSVAPELEREIKQVTGVAESGLFWGRKYELIA